MNVNLNCIYGDLLPRNNPHELEDELAEKLISQGYATKSDKNVDSSDISDSIKKENEELKEALKKSNDDLDAANEKIKVLEAEIKALTPKDPKKEKSDNGDK